MNITDLRKQPHLSVSSINDYIECGLQYKLGRIDRIQPEYTSDAMLFGSCIHKVLEEFYQARMKGEKLPLNYLIQRWETHWSESVEGKEDIQYKEGKDFETLLRDGKQLLMTYYRELPEDSFTVIGTELTFKFELEGLPVPIIGVIDLIEEDEAGNLIMEKYRIVWRNNPGIVGIISHLRMTSGSKTLKP